MVACLFTFIKNSFIFSPLSLKYPSFAGPLSLNLLLTHPEAFLEHGVPCGSGGG